VIDGFFAYAFTAGMLATVNPCGFAMLPAYLSYFLGVDESYAQQPAWQRVLRAGVVSISVAAGFLFVFTVIGAVVNAGAQGLVRWFEYATIVIGIGLVALGIAMLLGYRLPFTTPKLEKGGRDRTIWSMFVFGISYAVASIGCTLPLFASAVLGTFTSTSYLSGMLMVAAYGAGMALVLTALTVALALAQSGMVRWLRAAMQYVDRIAAVLLIVAGLYVTYYGLWVVLSDNGLNEVAGFWLIERAQVWQARLSVWFQDHGARAFGVLLVATVAVVASGTAIHRRNRARTKTAV
jgi:cytochrome c-type biogenesis protein